MPANLRAAVIGVGSMGKNHARIYADLEGVELVAVADPEASLCNGVAQKYRCRSYADHREMLAAEQLDLVSVVVPTRFHYNVALDVIEAGVPLLIEKPIAATIEQGQLLIDAAHKRGVPMTVGHIERFNPAVIALKQRLLDHDLGQIFQISTRRVGPFPARIGDVGVAVDLATHDMDILHYLTESGIRRMHVELGRHLHHHHEDMLSAILRFSNGIVGMLEINWLTPTKIRELAVVGERGMLVANYLTQDLIFYENDSCAGQHWPALAVMGVTEGQMVRLKVQRREPLYEELRSFATAVRDGVAPAMRSEDALHALVMAHQLIDAAEPIAPAEVLEPTKTAVLVERAVGV